ncbi:hypothetical protein BDW68DRAFT_159179 [Aspergillus falconensis]
MPARGEPKRSTLAAPVKIGAAGVVLVEVGCSGDVPVGTEVVVSSGGIVTDVDVVQVLVLGGTGAGVSWGGGVSVGGGGVSVLVG